MAKIIYYDENGVVSHERDYVRGKISKSAKKDDAGNFHVYAKPQVYYITVDENFNEVKREIKTRGRNRKGFLQVTDGPFAGNFVSSVETPVVSVE